MQILPGHYQLVTPFRYSPVVQIGSRVTMAMLILMVTQWFSINLVITAKQTLTTLIKKGFMQNFKVE